MLAAICGALEARDPSTRGHGLRVTTLARSVALRLAWDDETLATLELGARLHDIGKLFVPTSILRKAGPLDDQELAQIRRHPEAGARLVRPFAPARAAVPCVLFHHERWDGGGYPFGMTGEEIPIEARLLAIADAYDAMISYRPYRPPLRPEEALHELERCSGSQFDPELVDVFVRVCLARAVAV